MIILAHIFGDLNERRNDIVTTLDVTTFYLKSFWHQFIEKIFLDGKEYRI